MNLKNDSNIQNKKEKTLPFVSVIVITKNNAGTIEECIKSLINQSYSKEKYEIIFVDGRSKDGTDKIIKKYFGNFGQLKLLYEDYGTMGYARNLGVKESVGEIIAFTDADAILPPEWLDLIVDRFLESKLVVVGGLDVLVSGSESGKVIDSWRRLRRMTGIKAIPCIKTVNFAIRRDALISCGGFENGLSHFDEGELLARLYDKARISDILYDPEIIVCHKSERPVSIYKRIKKVYKKSIIGTPVLMRRYMARVAINNPLSPIATSFYIVLAWFFGLPMVLISILFGYFITLLIFTIVFYIIFLGIYLLNMFMKSHKIVKSTPFILTVDVIVRLIGTFVGLLKWLQSLRKKSIK